MKKIFLSLIAIFAYDAAQAQNPLISGDFNRDGKITVNDISHIINMANGSERLKEVTFVDGRMELVDYDPIFGVHDYVNLGLTNEQGDTIYWATCNVGAEKPEDYGGYYAWAETEPCTWQWASRNSVYGYKITGPNGNWIFLPAAGYLSNKDDVQNAGKVGYYRSKDQDDTYLSRSYIIYFDSTDYRWSNPYHIFGDSVRPVCVKSK